MFFSLSAPPTLGEAIDESNGHSIASLGTSSRRSAIASCVPHILKLVSLSCSLLTTDREFSTSEKKLLICIVVYEAKIIHLSKDLLDKASKLENAIKQVGDIERVARKVEIENGVQVLHFLAG